MFFQSTIGLDRVGQIVWNMRSGQSNIQLLNIKFYIFFLICQILISLMQSIEKNNQNHKLFFVKDWYKPASRARVGQ